MNLEAKWAIVTGGSRGLGFETAKGLIEAGFAVYIIGKDESRAKASAEKLDCKYRSTDVSDSKKFRQVLAEITKEAALANPDVQFAIVDMVITADNGDLLPNVSNLIFKEHEGSFEVGYNAGKLSKTGHVAFMGGMDVPIIRKFQTGWEEGAKYANPDIILCDGYAGSWGDPAKGKEIALSCFEQGADIIFAAGGSTGNGAYEAAAETGNFAVGVDSNQDFMQPGTMITSMMKNVDFAVYSAIKNRTEAGMVVSEIASYGSAENGVGPTWLVDGSSLFADEGPADMAAQVAALTEEVKEVRAKIVSGEIVVTDVTAGG